MLSNHQQKQWSLYYQPKQRHSLYWEDDIPFQLCYARFHVDFQGSIYDTKQNKTTFFEGKSFKNYHIHLHQLWHSLKNDGSNNHPVPYVFGWQPFQQTNIPVTWSMSTKTATLESTKIWYRLRKVLIFAKGWIPTFSRSPGVALSSCQIVGGLFFGDLCVVFPLTWLVTCRCKVWLFLLLLKNMLDSMNEA